jgi:hypothetical protein
MAYCGKCGQQVNEGARFCRYCGTPTGLAAAATAPVAAPAPAVSDHVSRPRHGPSSAVLAGATAGFLVLVAGGLGAWQAGFFAKTDPVAEPPAEGVPSGETASWQASYTDEFLSNSEARFLTAEANLRDYPSSDGTEVLRSLPEGAPVVGRYVRGRQADQLWFKLDEGGYIWDGNIGERASIYPAGMDGLFVGRPFADFNGKISSVGNYGEGPATCDTYDSLDGRYSVMFENNVATVFVTASPQLSTKQGVYVGMGLDDLKERFGDKLVSESNPYGGTDYFVWQKPDRGLRFLVDDGGKIQTIWSGTQSIRYVEGCL